MNKSIEIRRATDADLERLTEIYNHYVVTSAATFDTSPFTLEERRDWFHQHNYNPLHMLLVACLDGETVGYASSSQFRQKPAYDSSVETTIYLDPEFSSRGIGRQLYSKLLQDLEAAGVHRCYGVITLPNDASLALHESLGFEKAGHLTEVGYKFGKYWDTIWTEKTF
ncbi:MAG: GNAT family N-acetyltransferase [Gammaproteobacteria bacterium]|jgi:phosphinothricin acetyltransferase|nr:GNAT family N-acetyltransferase [Gammaproteobacteria bacterium]|tara:strand:+ start:138 stop:641 length:504 start_codon:yes stop_codon:yes gene_type:complete